MRSLSYIHIAFGLLIPGIGLAQTAGDTVKSTAPAVASTTPAVAYDQTHPLKTGDEWLPKWAVDLNFMAGKLSQDIHMIDLAKSYGDINSSNSTKFSDHQPQFSNGNSIGGDIALNYFFSHNRRWGVSIGAMYLHHTGELTLDEFKVDYRAKVQSGQDTGSDYRQIIRSNGPLIEVIEINSINIPVLAKYKWTFAKRGERPGFGLNVEAGPVIGIRNMTRSEASGNFTYEAVYSLDPNNKNSSIFGYDNSILNGTAGDPGKSLIITEEYLKLHRPDGLAVDEAFDAYRRGAGNYNVGLKKNIHPSMTEQTTHYDKLSIGAMIKAGISYQFAYNISFLLNGYFLYQRWGNTSENEQYKIAQNVVPGTNNVGYNADYNALSGGIKYSDYVAYGLTAGFRIYFGDKPDRDADGIVDALDCDMNKWGPKELGGCSDRDNDGIADGQDHCPDTYGLAEFDGCADTDNDGFPDNFDKCPLLAGSLRGCPKDSISGPVKVNLETEGGDILAPHFEYDTVVLYFAFNQAAITDSTANALNVTKQKMDLDSKVIVYISGHTDDIGNDKINLDLSDRRANVARDYLIAKGIDSSRVIIGSYGKRKPVTPNNNEENRAKNRRSEVYFLYPTPPKTKQAE